MTIKLGNILRNRGMVGQADLEKALFLQGTTRCSLGRILVGEGVLNHYHLHQALAEQQQLPFVDLMHELCDMSLLDKTQRESYVRLEVVPWKKLDGELLLATCNLNDELRDWAAATYDCPCRFVITTPRDIGATLRRAFIAEDEADARLLLWKKAPDYSARWLWNKKQKRGVIGIAVLLLAMTGLYPGWSLSLFWIMINMLYLVTNSFKLLLVSIGHERQKEIFIDKNQPFTVPPEKLPIYTILIPLFQERATLPKLVGAIRALNYPKSKLDVKLIVEEGDDDTIQAIKALHCESWFEIIRVPYSLPQTKPKACNYVLPYARGEYATIYDAEDIPDSNQLRRVVDRFASLPANVVCIQARLNYFNRHSNMLAKLFSLEYALWFDFMLPGLEAMRAPLPLGGTSNHFRVDKLYELSGWDPYNVTEDADLGMRLVMAGYHATVIDSLTEEEAPPTLKGWIGQRSRWIKGYIQTYMVHMRHIGLLWKKSGVIGVMAFQLFVGAPALVFLLTPVAIILWIALLHGDIHITPAVATLSLILGCTNLILGVLIPMMLSFVVIRKYGWWRLSFAAFLFPFYWLLHSIASFKACWQLIRRPHYWEKTKHG